MPNILRISCTFKEIESAVLNVESEFDALQKIIRNGQLLIIRDGKTYNALGAELR